MSNDNSIDKQVVSDVAKAAEAIEQELESHVPEGIEQAAVRQEAEARRLLNPEQLLEAEAEAREQLESWKENPTGVGKFGKEVLKSLNDVIEQYRQHSQKFEPEEVRRPLRVMAQKVGHMDSNFNPRSEDPHVVTKIRRRLQDDGRRLLWQVKTIVEEYEEEKTDTIMFLDKTAAVVAERLQLVEEQLRVDDLFFYKYGQQRFEFVTVVAAMEFALDMARDELQTLKDNPPKDISQMHLEAQIEKLTYLIQNIEVQLLDYRNRMWLTRASQQRIKSARQAHVTIGRQLQNHLDMTIPEMKDSLREIGVIYEDMKSAALATDLSAEANETIKRAARLSSEAIPETFRAGMTGIYKSETIRTLGELIAQMHTTEAEILTKFEQDEAENLNAMADANRLIADSSNRITDIALDRHMKEAAERLTKPEEDEEQRDDTYEKRTRRLGQ